jgi:hypothetical protein
MGRGVVQITQESRSLRGNNVAGDGLLERVLCGTMKNSRFSI